MSKVLAIANQKGGIGKTTTATALAVGLRVRGHRVLFIDTDPQCSASDTYTAKINGVPTLYDLMCEGDAISEVIQTTPDGDIVPCDPLLADASKKLTGLGDEKILRKALTPVMNNYDYVIIDTPPGAGILLHNALTAADCLIIPITADRYGVQGLSQLRDTIAAIQENTNPDLKISGLLLIKHNERTNLSKIMSESFPAIAAEMNTVLFDTYIRESVAAKEAQANRSTLYAHAPESTTARDYIEFLDELYERGII